MHARGRAGYTLAEALVALLVASVLTVCLATLLALVGRIASRQAETASAAETERIAAAVLGAELRALTRADATFTRDSVRLRAFRGTGVVCGASTDAVLMAYDGVRVPEPDKDSVLLVWVEREHAFDVAAVSASASCPDASAAIRITTRAPLPDSLGVPLLALVFETGAYSLARSALRYRRGAGGRQPLTDETLAGSGNRLSFQARDGAAIVVVSLRTRESRSAPVGRWSLALPQGGHHPPTDP